MSPIRVLLVEDNPADADLMRETLAESRLLLDLSVVVDGQQALDFLFARGPHAGALRPDLVLLDLNLPKVSGRDVLAAIKADAELRHTPVVVLTSSEAEGDVLSSYGLGANCFVTKPLNLLAYQTIVRAVAGFWFTIVKLPTRA